MDAVLRPASGQAVLSDAMQHASKRRRLDYAALQVNVEYKCSARSSVTYEEDTTSVSGWNAVPHANTSSTCESSLYMYAWLGHPLALQAAASSHSRVQRQVSTRCKSGALHTADCAKLPTPAALDESVVDNFLTDTARSSSYTVFGSRSNGPSRRAQRQDWNAVTLGKGQLHHQQSYPAETACDAWSDDMRCVVSPALSSNESDTCQILPRQFVSPCPMSHANYSSVPRHSASSLKLSRFGYAQSRDDCESTGCVGQHTAMLQGYQACWSGNQAKPVVVLNCKTEANSRMLLGGSRRSVQTPNDYPSDSNDSSTSWYRGSPAGKECLSHPLLTVQESVLAMFPARNQSTLVLAYRMFACAATRLSGTPPCLIVFPERLLVVALWTAAKLEEHRKGLPTSREIGQWVGTSAADIVGLEIRMMNALSWRPYECLLSEHATGA